MAVIAPPIGLATAAFTIMLAEPAVFRPLGFFVVLILAIVAGVIIRQIVARPREAPSVLTLVGVVYAGLIVVSLPQAVSALDAEDTTGAAFEALQLIGGLALVAVARTMFGTLDWRPYLRLAMAGAVVAAILALVRMTFGIADDLPLRGLFGHGEPTYRAVGTFSNSNYFGLFGAVASAMAFALAARGAGTRRLAWLACAAVIGVATVMAFSRGAVVALAVGVVATIWSRSRRAGLAALVVVGVAGVIVLPLLVETRLSITTGGLYAEPSTELAQSDSFRTDAASAGIRLFLENPLSGVGFGQFRFHAARYVGGNPTAYPAQHVDQARGRTGRRRHRGVRDAGRDGPGHHDHQAPQPPAGRHPGACHLCDRGHLSRALDLPADERADVDRPRDRACRQRSPARTGVAACRTRQRARRHDPALGAYLTCAVSPGSRPVTAFVRAIGSSSTRCFIRSPTEVLTITTRSPTNRRRSAPVGWPSSTSQADASRYRARTTRIHVTQNGEIYNYVELRSELEARGHQLTHHQ